MPGTGGAFTASTGGTHPVSGHCPRGWTSDLFFFSYIFLEVFVHTEYLCRPSEASTRYCVIPGGYPPQDDRVCHVLGRSWIQTQLPLSSCL
jgi:hypothetical protein